MSLCSNFKGKYFVSSILNAPSIKLLTSSVCCVLVGQVVYSIRDTIKKLPLTRLLRTVKYPGQETQTVG